MSRGHSNACTRFESAMRQARKLRKTHGEVASLNAIAKVGAIYCGMIDAGADITPHVHKEMMDNFNTFYREELVHMYKGEYIDPDTCRCP